MEDQFLGASPHLQELQRLLPTSLENENPYEVLSVSQDAGASELKKAFRALAKKHHPDKKSRSELSASDGSAFVKIQAAHEFLTQDSSRRVLDLHLSHISEKRKRLDLVSKEKKLLRDLLSERECRAPVRGVSTLIDDIRTINEQALSSEFERRKRMGSGLSQSLQHPVVVEWRSKAQSLSAAEKLAMVKDKFGGYRCRVVSENVVDFGDRESAILAILDLKQRGGCEKRWRLKLGARCEARAERCAEPASSGLRDFEDAVMSRLRSAAKKQKEF